MTRDKSSAARRENDELLIVFRELGRPDSMTCVFVCECGDPDCEGIVRLTIAEFEWHRRERSPVLYPGHHLAG